MNCSKIIGTGHYLPSRVVTNRELTDTVDTSESWIVSRTGIKQRHISALDETSCDLAEQAARHAIMQAGIKAEAIDMIVLATTTPDLVFPSTACLLQQRLGIHGSPAFDIQAVCSGFIYALDIADKFIKTDAASCVLVVGTETMSRIIDWQDRSTCILFGDGAGAVILQASKVPGILSTHLHADGRYQDLLKVPCGISRRPAEQDSFTPYVTMQGNEVFRVAVNTLGGIVEETLSTKQLTIDDIDWLVPHQANIRIIQAMAKKLGLPMERVIVTVDQHGNTSAASIPIALDVAVKDGRIKRGDSLLLEAFGGGFTWGSALIRY